MSPSHPDCVLLALHYQNDAIHAEGKIGVGLAKDGSLRREALIGAAGRLLAGARANGVPVISVRIAFRPIMPTWSRTAGSSATSRNWEPWPRDHGAPSSMMGWGRCR